jgi:hypothetical protein
LRRYCRVADEPAFAAARLRECIETTFAGGILTSKAILRDYIRPTPKSRST